jgi:lipopolysaccharide biosynthesis regulator YciM
MKLWRLACCAPLALLAGAAPARADAAAVAAALRALDLGEDAAARPALAAELARLSFYQALAERGAARQAAAERALALAADGSWVKAAAEGLLAAEAAAPAEGENRFAPAIGAYERALAAAPEEARLWRLLGELKLDTDDRAGAKAAFQRATAIDPTNALALEGLGDVLQLDGDFQGAFNAYNHAAAEAPKSVSVLVGRAASRLFFGDRDGAAADLERALPLAQPGAQRSRVLLGIVYLHAYLRELPKGLDRAEEAVAMWAQLGRPDMVAATLNAAARALLETGNAEAAEAWYDRGWQAVEASAMPPEERTIWRVRWLHGKARSAAARRDLERADEHAAEARALMAADAANREHYDWIGPYLDGYLALARRRYAEAIAAFQRSDTERAQIRALLADAYARNRDRENARLWYRRALEASTGLDVESVIVRPLATAWLERNR